jgi:F420H(2)-dependent quinone reductase
MAVENTPGSPSKQDPRQRIAVPLFRAIGPLMRLVLRLGLPAGPNALLTVRGRVTGRPYSTPVAIWEFGGRRFVQASFGRQSDTDRVSQAHESAGRVSLPTPRDSVVSRCR